MTTINIEDWQGNELHEIFGNFAKKGLENAKGTVAVRTGNLRASTKLKQTGSESFQLYTRGEGLRRRNGRPYNYAPIYHDRGYVSKPAHPYIHTAYDGVGLDGGVGSGSYKLTAKENAVIDRFVRRAGGRSRRIARRLLK